jgi:hypothetical protein
LPGAAAKNDLVTLRILVVATATVEVRGPVPGGERIDTQGKRTSRRVDQMANNLGTGKRYDGRKAPDDAQAHQGGSATPLHRRTYVGGLCTDQTF